MDANSWVVVINGTQKEGKYTDRQVTELVRSHGAGAILVWREGMAQWMEATKVPELQMSLPEAVTPVVAAPPQPQSQPQPPITEAPQVEEKVQKIKESGRFIMQEAAKQIEKIKEAKSTTHFLPHLRGLDWLLKRIAQGVSKERLDSLDEWAIKIGHIALLAAGLMLVIVNMILALRGSGGRLSFFVAALVALPIVCVIQYVAHKFLGAGKAMIAKSPSNLNSSAFLDCFGLLALVAAIFFCISGLLTAILTKDGQPLALSLGAAFLSLYLTGVALNGSTVNVTVAGNATAGQEAISMLAFLIKAVLRLVPVTFGVGLVSAVLILLILAMKSAIADDGDLSLIIISLASQYSLVFGLALMPLVLYLAALFLYLGIDILRVILALPERLDRLMERLVR